MENIRTGTLLGMGNPLLDISATVDNDFLERYGMKPDDAILAEEKHKPLYEQLISEYHAEYIAGGSVQNSFRVAQWVLQKPNVAVFFGCVGVDKYSKIIEDKARQDGVDVRYQYTEEVPTGRCGVLITGTHRSLCADLGAANHFKIDHIHQPANKKLIENAEYFYISGFFLTVSPPSILEVAKHALQHNRWFIMNLSAPFISQFYKEPLMAALPYVDLIFGNETETEAFAKEQGWETDDLKEIGKKICKLPKQNENRQRIAVITQGQHPVLLIQGDKVEEFPVVPLKLEEIVDTNGAGDAFVGGFLSQFIQKQPLGVCVRCGIWAARQIIQRSGCTFEGKPDFQP
ncbi:unnamed protein product [Hermetia illucens]|uniref:Adenosine kinase n=1 Tax=Hermetia illucens TaxID=343691 RepID=A0A7R8UI90_HERIL|nr:adenosine kinase isoform X1 [Hermetia illucens]CAD7081365.1 unnamed protein product [Hermetia illucens]